MNPSRRIPGGSGRSGSAGDGSATDPGRVRRGIRYKDRPEVRREVQPRPGAGVRRRTDRRKAGASGRSPVRTDGSPRGRIARTRRPGPSPPTATCRGLSGVVPAPSPSYSCVPRPGASSGAEPGRARGGQGPVPAAGPGAGRPGPGTRGRASRCCVAGTSRRMSLSGARPLCGYEPGPARSPLVRPRPGPRAQRHSPHTAASVSPDRRIPSDRQAGIAASRDGPPGRAGHSRPNQSAAMFRPMVPGVRVLRTFACVAACCSMQSARELSYAPCARSS